MEQENRLVIEIKNNNEIPLTDLTLSLLNVSHQYKRFLLKNGVDIDKSENVLFVKQVISGSVIIELAPLMTFALPLIQDFNTVCEFVKHIKNLTEYCLGSTEKKPEGVEKKDFEQFHEILNITAKDNASSIIFKACDNSTQNVVVINSTQANAAQNAIKRAVEDMMPETSNFYSKQLLKWFQVRFDKNTRPVGDRAVIENITSIPLKVVFEKDDIKQGMIGNPKNNKPWQELAYIVDVEVLKLGDQPKVYKIIECYTEETFDPKET